MAFESVKQSFNDESLRRFLRGDSFCDVNLIVEDECFTCHKAVLRVHSDYFLKMFSESFIECKKKDIRICGVSASTFATVLDYLYCQEVVINEKNVEELLGAACMFFLDELKRKCVVLYKRVVCEENCPKITEIGLIYQLNDLLESCTDVIARGFYRLESTFLSVDCKLAFKVLTCTDLSVLSENDAADAALKWLKVHPEELRHVETLISAVRLTECDPLYVRSVLMTSEFIKNSQKTLTTCAKYCDQASYDLFFPKEIALRFPRPSTGLSMQVSTVLGLSRLSRPRLQPCLPSKCGIFKPMLLIEELQFPRS